MIIIGESTSVVNNDQSDLAIRQTANSQWNAQLSLHSNVITYNLHTNRQQALYMHGKD